MEGLEGGKVKQVKNVGRIHIREEELCALLGYKGGAIRFIGWMRDYGEIGIVICHPDMPVVEEGDVLSRIERKPVKEVSYANHKERV